VFGFVVGFVQTLGLFHSDFATLLTLRPFDSR
jgi:hypothetical protein